MNKFIKILALLIFPLLQCCKEGAEIITYPIIFSNSTITDKSIKVFTVNGEITDTATINYLMKKYSFFFRDINNSNLKGNIIATYLSPENVEYHNLYSENTDTLTVLNDNSLICWEEKDTVSNPIGIFFDVYFFYTIYKYKPRYYEEFRVPYSTGYSKAAKYKKCYFVKTDGENLILPMMDFLYIQDIMYTYNLEINNEFCKDSVSVLGTNDTIVVCEYALKLKKH